MAGGWSKRGAGIPLQERVRPGVDPVPDDSPARHCWVEDPVDRSAAKRPGLLVEWRHDPGRGWLGRVVYLARVRPAEWTLVEEWLPASVLTAM